MPLKDQPAFRKLSTQLIIAFVFAIITTTIAAGLPAYWLITEELEQRAWERVGNAERVTLSLLEAEKRDLSSLTILTSQRPTLQRYLREGANQDLFDYPHTSPPPNRGRGMMSGSLREVAPWI